MKKFKHFSGSVFSAFSILAFMAGFFIVGVYAASTIGTNITTTGNMHVGGSAAQTVFEVQGTASASYLLTGNSLQVAGFASVAYSRFGTGTTGHSLAATDDVLFTGLVEFNDNAFFDAKLGVNGAPSTLFEVQGTASASYLMTANSLQVASALSSVAYSRFGTGTTGHSLAATDDVLFTGLVEFDDKAFFDGTASVTTAFEVVSGGYASASTLFASDNLIVDSNTASNSSVYVAEMGAGKTGTASFFFAPGDSSSTGTCIQLKDSTGEWVYARVRSGGTTFTVSTTRCH